MKITESQLIRVIVNILQEQNVTHVDFRNKTERKSLVPIAGDAFIFSGNAGQIARVIEMKRDTSVSGGIVVYEQYVNRSGEWIQEPGIELSKSVASFNTRYMPYEGTITHLAKAKEETDADDKHITNVMAAAGFSNWKSLPREVTSSKEYSEAFAKAMKNLPSFG